jgi:hypothetical protein
LLGAAKRTLDGEDGSEMIAKEGKASESGARKVVHSPTASNNPDVFEKELLTA